MSKRKEGSNYSRVYKIMGDIMGVPDLMKRGYNIHHIVFKSDIERNPDLWKGFDLNGLSNLFPLLRADHARLHQMADNGGFFGLRITKEVPDLLKMPRKAAKNELKKFCRSKKIKFDDRLEVNDFS